MRVERIVNPPIKPGAPVTKERGTKNEADTANAVDNDVSHNNDEPPRQGYQRYTPQKQVIAAETKETVPADGPESVEVKHLNIRA